ncbi:acyl-CoA dehydrogenase family protein [Arthrobacter sp. B0490]|uniref:acyl-CoA dehydrogenase family protein n=1 Tax=Arthrobacter sp. B0490 TaxID=2058891 RepID=UPI000CE34486|nr:acyl-CoA dehydrogenase family protein [Arthrobacter sp. B0490]
MTDYETVAAKYRPIFERIAAGALEREQDRVLPFEQIEWLKNAGFGAARVPAEYGGDGLTWPQFTRLLIELTTADSNITQALRGHIALVEENLYHYHHQQDRSVWLTRFAAGDIAGNAWTEPGKGGTSTVLEEADGVLSLTGRKFYTTGTIFADWVDVTAQRPDGTDVSVVVSTQAAGVVTLDDWDGFGQRLTGSGTTIFDHTPVSPENVYAFDSRFPYQTALYQHILLVVLTGIGKAAELEVAEQVRGRDRVFSHGSASLVRHDPQVLQVVGEISAKVYAAESTTLRVAEALEDVYQARLHGGAAEEAANIAAELATAQAQVALSSLIPEAAGALFDVLGASSTSTSKGLDRHWRNARTTATHNPSIYKAKIVGDWTVNATPPPFIWTIGVAGVEAPLREASVEG